MRKPFVLSECEMKRTRPMQQRLSQWFKIDLWLITCARGGAWMGFYDVGKQGCANARSHTVPYSMSVKLSSTALPNTWVVWYMMWAGQRGLCASQNRKEFMCFDPSWTLALCCFKKKRKKALMQPHTCYRKQWKGIKNQHCSAWLWCLLVVLHNSSHCTHSGSAVIN